MATSLWLSFALALLPTSLAWNFSVVGNPTVCQPLTVNFTGGTPPWAFEVIQFPPNNTGTSNNSSGWHSAYPYVHIFEFDTANDTSGGTGSMLTRTFDWPFGLNATGSSLVVVGSDATGFGTGGTSSILSIAEAASGTAICKLPPDWLNETDVSSAFHHLPIATNCAEQYITYRGDLMGPISIDTIVPGGQSYRISANNSHANDTNYANQYFALNWMIQANVGDAIGIVLDVLNSTPTLVSPLMTVTHDCTPSGAVLNSRATALGVLLGCLIAAALLVVG